MHIRAHNDVDHQYLEVLQELLYSGLPREGRNARTYAKFGRQLRFRLEAGFPLLTTKRVNFHAIVVELLWFLRGGTNVRFLHHHGVHIWDKWADENGDLGPVYGAQWRSWPNQPGDPHKQLSHIDQIGNVLTSLRDSPYSRRHIVTAWNPAEVDNMALPPCHCLFQFNVRPEDPLRLTSGDIAGKPKYLDCQLYQRSADWFIGVPFNIASYALLTQLIARELDLIPGEFIHTFGDLHLYDQHLVQAKVQMRRSDQMTLLPEVEVSPGVGLFDLTSDHFTLHGYHPQPAIKAEAVE